MQWDFWSLNPESAHQVTYLMGDRGIPKTCRHMNGYGSHTYLWINAAGEKFWVKYHFHTDQGVEGLTGEEADRASPAQDADFHRRDLYEAIARGDFPSWTLSVQVMPYEDAKTYRLNPFDLTKVWPHSDYPLIKVGTMTLNRNPENFFAQIEQAAFEPSAIVPGHRLLARTRCCSAGPSPTPTRTATASARTTCSCRSTGRASRCNTYTQDGPMAYDHRGDAPGLRAELRAAAATPTRSARSRRAGRPTARWCVRPTRCARTTTTSARPGTLVREVLDDAQREALRRDGRRAPARRREVAGARARLRLLEAASTPRPASRSRSSSGAGLGGANPGGDADDAKVVTDPVVETDTNAAH